MSTQDDMWFLGKLLGIVLLFGIINLTGYGIQSCWHEKVLHESEYSIWYVIPIPIKGR